MLLTDSKIRERCEKENLIYPFNNSQLQPCSYDVTLSESIIRYTGSGIIDASLRTLSNHLEYYKFSMNEDGYILDPGEFILGSTNEYITLPDNLAARYEGKSSMGRIGLASHITAGFIDPGFSGTITLEIKNENNHQIRIKPNMPIGQFCFFETYSVERPYGSEALDSHYQGQIGTTPSAIRYA